MVVSQGGLPKEKCNSISYIHTAHRFSLQFSCTCYIYVPLFIQILCCLGAARNMQKLSVLNTITITKFIPSCVIFDGKPCSQSSCGSQFSFWCFETLARPQPSKIFKSFLNTIFTHMNNNIIPASILFLYYLCGLNVLKQLLFHFSYTRSNFKRSLTNVLFHIHIYIVYCVHVLLSLLRKI